MKHTRTDNHISRRAFVGMTAGGIVGLMTPTLIEGNEPDSRTSSVSADKSLVALVRNQKILDKERHHADVRMLRTTVDKAVCLSLDEQDPIRAWEKIVTPSDVVGIKVNCLGGRGITTNHELVQVVIESLLDIGIPPGNIIVWDRSDNDLRRGGFSIQKSPERVRFMGPTGLNPQIFSVAGIDTQINTLVTETCTALINVPVLKTHVRSGFSGALKNNMGAISNPRFFHPESCRAVGDLNSLPSLKSKTKLTIIDALRPQYDKGPGDFPAARWNYNGVIVGTDMVAIDSIGLSILEEKRQEVHGAPWPLTPPVTYLTRAEELNVGESALKNIIVHRDEG